MAIRIRRIEARDKAAWLPLFKGYIAFYKATVPDEVIETVWQRMIAGEVGSHIGLVAVDDVDSPFGIAHILFHRSTWSPTFYCYLEDLFVDPAHRGSGAGRKLIEAVYAEADMLGATRTYWATQETNYRARTLYDSLATQSPFIQYRR